MVRQAENGATQGHQWAAELSSASHGSAAHQPEARLLSGPLGAMTCVPKSFSSSDPHPMTFFWISDLPLAWSSCVS